MTDRLDPLHSAVTLSEGPLAELERSVKQHRDDLVVLRRDLHRHPELGNDEVRTTRVVADRLRAVGLEPRVLPTGTGLLCDLPGTAPWPSGAIALRADIDALPVQDEKDAPYRSSVPGVCHACGHDVHTALVLGAGLALRDVATAGFPVPPVRLVFQPAEEILPGGSYDVITAGGMDGVERIFCVHCDPRLRTGQVGLRTGPVTSACDRILVTLHGPGGHTARPHLTADLVHALGTLLTGLPGALSRRLDPRAGVSLVWGRVSAGSAANTIPAVAEAEGTLRCLDSAAWQQAPTLVESLAHALVAPYGASVTVESLRGVPPLVNDPTSIELLRDAAHAALGPDAVTSTDQSLGAEDFAWYLEHVPGALARLGVRPSGTSVMPDLHRGGFAPDEDAIGVGARLLATTALLAGAGRDDQVTSR